MATDLSYVQYVSDQLHDAGLISFRKMFGEYMVYCDGKPVVLVCDNTSFVKIKDEIKGLMEGMESGYPYHGATLHYSLDIDNHDLSTQVVRILTMITPYPKSKKKAIKNP
ncbi:MAG: TfoX/Sxy family protein [Bacilli bacterium]